MDQDQDQNQNDSDSQTQTQTKPTRSLVDTSCGKSAGVLFFALFLLMLIILGTILRKGKESIAWMLFVIVILLGLGALVVLIMGKGYSKEATPWLFSFLTLMMSLLGAASIAIAKPEKTETSELAIAYIAVILPGLCGFLYSPIYGFLHSKYKKLRRN